MELCLAVAAVDPTHPLIEQSHDTLGAVLEDIKEISSSISSYFPNLR